jgi:hypothetical protein
VTIPPYSGWDSIKFDDNLSLRGLRKLKTKKAPGLNDPNIKILKIFVEFFAEHP